jgi:hypothetical protein
MKLFGLILLFLKLFDEVFGVDKSISPLASAFTDIKKSLEVNNRQISIQNFGDNRKVLKHVLTGASENSQLSFRHQKLKKNQTDYEIDESGIFIFDNLTSLSEFNYKTNFTNEGPKDWQFFVYIDKAKASGIKAAISETKVFQKKDNYNLEDRSEIINFQYFLIQEKDFFVLYTFVWYTQEKCGRQQLVEVNRFNKHTKKWTNLKFKIDKFDNFFECKLMFFYDDTVPPEIGLNKIKNKMEGFQNDLLVEISKVLKFSFEWNYGPNVTDLYRFLPISLYLNRDMFCVNFCYPYVYDSKINPRRHLTEYYYTSARYFVVPPGPFLNGYEKLLFPFDEPTWTLIFVTFVVAFVTIFVVNRMKNKIRNIVIGENVSNPSLNIAAHFFGLGQQTIPRQNFARFLAMVFILYCLIIRTAWQSKMFEFMQQEMRKPGVQTIEETKEKFDKQYVPWSKRGWYQYVNGKKKGQTRTTDAHSSITNILTNSSFDGYCIIETRYWPQYLETFQSGEIFDRVLKDEPFDERQLGFSFPLNHKFYKTFNGVIRSLNEAGVIKHLVAKYYESLNPKFYEKPIQLVDKNGRKTIHKKYLETTYHKTHFADKEPKVLTLEDLEFGFVIWLGSLVLPLIVYFLEIIFHVICIIITKIRNRNQVKPSNQEQIELMEVTDKSETQIEEIHLQSLENKNARKLESLNVIKTLEQLEASDDVFGAKIENLNEEEINRVKSSELITNTNRIRQAWADQD